MKSKDDIDNKKIKEINEDLKKNLKILKIGSDKEKSDSFLYILSFSRDTGKNFEPQLKKELKEILHTFIIKASLQDACSAAIGLAKIGEQSKDVAAPMLFFLHEFAKDPEGFYPPSGLDHFQMEIFLNSNIFSEKLISFIFLIIKALSLFKDDEYILKQLSGIIYECCGGEECSDRLKELNKQTGPKFYNPMIENVVNNCLRCMGVIKERGKYNETLEWWSDQGNAVAKEVLE